jgi:hypothetical protein
LAVGAGCNNLVLGAAVGADFDGRATVNSKTKGRSLSSGEQFALSTLKPGSAVTLRVAATE